MISIPCSDFIETKVKEEYALKLSDQSILSFYQDIATLDENHGVYLVQHTVSKRIFVKKILTVYNTNVFQYLKEKPVAHTPRIYELIIDDPTLIVIEEYITGRTLQQILDTNGNLSEDQALRIIEKICVILKDLHSASPSIIHRDIKPSNIILFLLAALIGFTNAGTYSDLKIWSSYCIILLVVCIISIILKRNHQNSKNNMRSHSRHTRL